MKLNSAYSFCLRIIIRFVKNGYKAIDVIKCSLAFFTGGNKRSRIGCVCFFKCFFKILFVKIRDFKAVYIV